MFIITLFVCNHGSLVPPTLPPSLPPSFPCSFLNPHVTS